MVNKETHDNFSPLIFRFVVLQQVRPRSVSSRLLSCTETFSSLSQLLQQVLSALLCRLWYCRHFRLHLLLQTPHEGAQHSSIFSRRPFSCLTLTLQVTSRVCFPAIFRMRLSSHVQT